MKNFKSIIGGLALLCVAITMPNITKAADRITVTCKSQNLAGTILSVPDTTSGTDTTYLIYSPGTTGNKPAPFTQYGDVTYTWDVVPSIAATTTGTVIVQGSQSGTYSSTGDWVTLVSSTAEYNGSSSISISGTDPIHGYFILPNNQFKYIRVRYVTAGSGQKSRITGSVIISPHN